MAIVRLANYPADHRILTDLAYYVNPVSISSSQAKTGTYSYDLGLNTGPFGKALLSASAAVRMGYWHYMVNTIIEDSCVIYQAGHALGFFDSENWIAVRADPSLGELQVVRPVASNTLETLETASLPSPYGTTGTWFHVGITHSVDDVSGFLSVYINGVRVLNHVGDSRPSHWNGSAQEFRDNLIYVLGPGGTSASGTNGFSNAFVDDMYIDSIVGESDSVVPLRRLHVVLPTGTGADAGFTPSAGANYENVDENPNDGDTTYNSATSANLRDTFAVADFSLPANHSFVKVMPFVMAKRLGSTEQISLHAYDGSLYGDSSDLDLSASYDVPVFAEMPLQPDGTTWNETDFNAMQFGYRSRGTF